MYQIDKLKYLTQITQKMNKKQLFRECIEEAIRIGRPHLHDYIADDKPTQQEWDLALILFKQEVEGRL